MKHNLKYFKDAFPSFAGFFSSTAAFFLLTLSPSPESDNRPQRTFDLFNFCNPENNVTIHTFSLEKSEDNQAHYR